MLQIGEGLGVDDDEQIIVGDIAAGAILDPIAARVGAEQDQLEDAAALALVGELGFDGILKFIEQDAGDPFQLAALGGGKMIEAGAPGQRASGRSIAVMPWAAAMASTRLSTVSMRWLGQSRETVT